MTALGTSQTVVVCVPAGSGFQGACPSGQVESVVQAYVVTASEGARLDAMGEPFDSATAGAYFGFAFASTIFVYLFSLGCGYVLKTVRTS
jgi:hypothetical protein